MTATTYGLGLRLHRSTVGQAISGYCVALIFLDRARKIRLRIIVILNYKSFGQCDENKHTSVWPIVCLSAKCRVWINDDLMVFTFGACTPCARLWHRRHHEDYTLNNVVAWLFCRHTLMSRSRWTRRKLTDKISLTRPILVCNVLDSSAAKPIVKCMVNSFVYLNYFQENCI